MTSGAVDVPCAVSPAALDAALTAGFAVLPDSTRTSADRSTLRAFAMRRPPVRSLRGPVATRSVPQPVSVPAVRGPAGLGEALQQHGGDLGGDGELGDAPRGFPAVLHPDVLDVDP